MEIEEDNTQDELVIEDLRCIGEYIEEATKKHIHHLIIDLADTFLTQQEILYQAEILSAPADILELSCYLNFTSIDNQLFEILLQSLVRFSNVKKLKFEIGKTQVTEISLINILKYSTTLSQLNELKVDLHSNQILAFVNTLKGFYHSQLGTVCISFEDSTINQNELILLSALFLDRKSQPQLSVLEIQGPDCGITNLDLLTPFSLPYDTNVKRFELNLSDNKFSSAQQIENLILSLAMWGRSEINENFLGMDQRESLGVRGPITTKLNLNRSEGLSTQIFETLACNELATPIDGHQIYLSVKGLIADNKLSNFCQRTSIKFF